VRLLVVGAGGHAKVVIDAADAAGFEIVGVIGTAGDPAEVLGRPVVTAFEGIEVDGFIVAIGDNEARSRMFDAYVADGFAALTVVHPSAIVGSDVTIGAGTFLAAGVIVNAGARVGTDVILNTGCSVDHDCVIGDHSHVGPGSALCGAVTLGEGVLLGVGVSAAPGTSVGRRTVVGAGAAIVDPLPAGTVCVGVPAVPIRSLEARDRD
jgi:sugar O-acyltransferase (sialic acid O-acetyltransferase NeuD family)